MLTYIDCVDLFNKAKDKAQGKTLDNNTVLVKMPDSVSYGIKLYDTIIIKISPGDYYSLYANGHYTQTTKTRLNKYSPAPVFQVDGKWYIKDQIDGYHIPFTEGVKLNCNGSIIGV